MIREVVKDTDLAIRFGAKLDLVSHTNYTPHFFSFCEDVEVVIKTIKTMYSIFVVEKWES